jgi:hypothetical protein
MYFLLFYLEGARRTLSLRYTLSIMGDIECIGGGQPRGLPLRCSHFAVLLVIAQSGKRVGSFGVYLLF